MSRITNPDTESSVSCGFYNGLNHDRKYNSLDVSTLFDGIIRDGIFASIGTCFIVTNDEEDGNRVKVGIGKAWFENSWTENDAILPIECVESEILLDRIDAIVIETNSDETVRDNFIKFVIGTPATEPVRPTMTHTRYVNQHALCYIYRPAGSTSILQSNITNMVGSDETPFVTGILDTISASELLLQWEGQINEFVSDKTGQFNARFEVLRARMENAAATFGEWTTEERERVEEFFEELRGQLADGDVAFNLQMQINDFTEITANEVNSWFVN